MSSDENARGVGVSNCGLSAAFSGAAAWLREARTSREVRGVDASWTGHLFSRGAEVGWDLMGVAIRTLRLRTARTHAPGGDAQPPRPPPPPHTTPRMSSLDVLL